MHVFDMYIVNPQRAKDTAKKGHISVGTFDRLRTRDVVAKFHALTNTDA